MPRTIFFGKKLILKSGREIDLSCEQEDNGETIIVAICNHQDPIHEVPKPLSLRMAWKRGSSDPIIAYECRGGAPPEGKPLPEAEILTEGLNGHNDQLHLSEIVEMQSTMMDIYQKVLNEEANQPAIAQST